MRRWIALGLLLACPACDTILGLNQFTFDGSTDAADECSGPSFDPTRLTPFLAPDGALPPLPALHDAGADG
jgi:hypothetical protein